MSKELAATVDMSQIRLPYHLCTAEEKATRREASVRAALKMKFKKENNEKPELTVDQIAEIFGVPRSNLFRWLKMEAKHPGAGRAGYKMGPNDDNIKEKLNKEDKDKLFYPYIILSTGI